MRDIMIDECIHSIVKIRSFAPPHWALHSLKSQCAEITVNGKTGTRTLLDIAKEQNAIPFDVPNVELGHHDGKCSFDAIIEKYNLEDRALQELAKIVRGADTDQPDPPPESICLEAIAEGFRQITKDDFDNISKQFYLYDALYAYCSTN
jgi:hypothetical protein